jgi:hypothetical protein
MNECASCVWRKEIQKLVVLFWRVDLLLKQTVRKLRCAVAGAGEKREVGKGMPQQIAVAPARPPNGATQLNEALIFAVEGLREYARRFRIPKEFLKQTRLFRQVVREDEVEGVFPATSCEQQLKIHLSE